MKRVQFPHLPVWVVLLQLVYFASPFLVASVGSKRSRIPLESALPWMAFSVLTFAIAWLATRHAALRAAEASLDPELRERYRKVPAAFALGALIWFCLFWGFVLLVFVRWPG